MDEDVVDVNDDGTSPQGTSILEREAKLRGAEVETVRFIEPGQTADEDEDDENEGGKGDEDEDEIIVTRLPDPVPTLTDPGEFKPADYSFEVQVFDDEGKNARTHKIKSVEQWDELLERDPNLGSASALLKAQRAATKMETSLDRDQREHDGKKTAYETEKTQLEASKATTDTWIAEVGYLQSKGDLPAVDKKYVDADWSDPEIAKQPGVKEQLALLNYMRAENKRRTDAKLKPMTSILDAFNAYQLDQARKGNVTSRQRAATQRKAAGARVASVSAAPASVAPSGISVGRGGSLRDLGRSAF